MLSINLVFQIMILLLPFYFETYLSYDPRHMGLFLGIAPLATLVSAPLAGTLSDRFGPRLPALAGWACGAAGFGLMAWRGVEQGLNGHTGLLKLGLALLGVAGGFFNSPVIATMMGSVGTELRPYASSLGSLMRNLGFLAGTTLGSLWLVQFMAAQGWHGPAVLQEADSFSAPQAAFTYALAAVFWICAAWCALLTAAYAWYPNRPAQQAGAAPPG